MTLQEWILDIPAVRDEAKALWGEEMTSEGNYLDESLPAYLFQLEQMLYCVDPEQYYREHKPKESK